MQGSGGASFQREMREEGEGREVSGEGREWKRSGRTWRREGPITHKYELLKHYMLYIMN